MAPQSHRVVTEGGSKRARFHARPAKLAGGASPCGGAVSDVRRRRARQRTLGECIVCRSPLCAHEQLPSPAPRPRRRGARLRGRGARTRDVGRELQRVRAAEHGERERAAAPAQQLRDALRARAVERLSRDVRQLVAHLPLGYQPLGRMSTIYTYIVITTIYR
jgi:hypothetical protein